MIERVSYVADDGTAFEDEDECIDYERGLMLKKYEHDIHMWDSAAEAVEVMDNWFESMGYSSPLDGHVDYNYAAGRHYYYQDNDCWYEADDLIEKVRRMMKIFGV